MTFREFMIIFLSLFSYGILKWKGKIKSILFYIATNVRKTPVTYFSFNFFLKQYDCYCLPHFSFFFIIIFCFCHVVISLSIRIEFIWKTHTKWDREMPFLWWPIKKFIIGINEISIFISLLLLLFRSCSKNNNNIMINHTQFSISKSSFSFFLFFSPTRSVEEWEWHKTIYLYCFH